MKDQSIVYLDSVSKIYGSGSKTVYAVQDVSLDIQPGEFFSLLGSSGSGKTTTLRLIGGFEIPEYGSVSIGGVDVTTQPPYQRDVHTVFQSYALFPHLTVAENIAYPLRIAKVSSADIAPRVTEALRMFQIQELGDRRPAQLSGGQQQRVALARALISRPKVLLLDEPLSALDAKIRQEVRQELRDLQRKTGLTFIYVTHDQEEALALSDRIAVMHKGHVEQIGQPKDIYDHPSSHFVAQFIGKTNLLSGTLVAIDTDVAMVNVKGVEIKATPPDQKIDLGTAVTLMIRPERIQTDSATVTRDNQISAKLASVTYTGQLLESTFDTQIGAITVTHLSDSQTPNLTGAIGWSRNDTIILPNP